MYSTTTNRRQLEHIRERASDNEQGEPMIERKDHTNELTITDEEKLFPLVVGYDDDGNVESGLRVTPESARDELRDWLSAGEVVTLGLDVLTFIFPVDDESDPSALVEVVHKFLDDNGAELLSTPTGALEFRPKVNA
jgi:hypothetical protein